jgi:hypothetical protein
VDLAGGQVLEPCPGRIAEVQGQVADDDFVAGRPAQLAFSRKGGSTGVGAV